jgi:hypothetical protein
MLTSPNTLELGLSVGKLLSVLEDHFPTPLPGPSDKIETIMYKAGQRCVVNYIKQLYEEEG